MSERREAPPPRGDVAIDVVPVRDRPVRDADLESLLHGAYVGGGFTPPELAATAFVASAVRARGEILCAWALDEPERPAGMVIVVPRSSAARRIGRADEAEIHLLAVDERHRAKGIGHRLVEACERGARGAGYEHIVLWTQSTMHAAQRLYVRRGFVRAPARDEEISRLTGRAFLVYEKRLGELGVTAEQ